MAPENKVSSFLDGFLDRVAQGDTSKQKPLFHSFTDYPSFSPTTLGTGLRRPNAPVHLQSRPDGHRGQHLRPALRCEAWWEHLLDATCVRRGRGRTTDRCVRRRGPRTSSGRAATFGSHSAE